MIIHQCDREIVSFEFLNNDNDMSHSIHSKLVRILNDDSVIYKLYDSPAVDSSGFINKETGHRSYYILIDSRGYPYVFDITKERIITRLSDFPCFIDGKSVVDGRTFDQGANFRDYPLYSL